MDIFNKKDARTFTYGEGPGENLCMLPQTSYQAKEIGVQGKGTSAFEMVLSPARGIRRGKG